MSAIQDNVESASARYSAAFTKGHLALPPAKKYLVVTCMDARIDPAQAFGIELGDAHVIRNVSFFISFLLFFFYLLAVYDDSNIHSFADRMTTGRRLGCRRAPVHRHQPATAGDGRDCAGQAYGVWDAHF